MLINYITKEVEKLAKPFKLNKKEIIENINFKLNILRNNINALEINIANLKVKNKAQETEIATLKAQLKKSINTSSDKNRTNNKAKVLIADDNKTNLHILEYMLKRYSLDVVSHNNGLDVLKSIQDDNFDLIILDSIMPKLDGYRTIIEIRKNKNTQDIPVILHKSISSESENTDNIYKLGFNSYLAKPFDIADLELILKKYIPSIKTSF